MCLYFSVFHFCSDYSNLQWSPAHVMPPLDESTPLSHTHYWDPTLGMLATVVIMMLMSVARESHDS